TLPVAEGQALTPAAVAWQRVAFGFAESYLLRAVCHLHDRKFQAIAGLELGQNAVVAGRQVAVMFHGEGVAARLLKRAQAAGQTGFIADRLLKGLNKKASDIVAHPFIENRRQETAPLLGAHGTAAHLAVAEMFDNRNELDPFDPVFLEEIVDVEGLFGVD